MTRIASHEVFQRTYAQSLWGGASREATTVSYRRLLGRALPTGRVKRVVDLGCDDWRFGRPIDWTGADCRAGLALFRHHR